MSETAPRRLKARKFDDDAHTRFVQQLLTDPAACLAVPDADPTDFTTLMSFGAMFPSTSGPRRYGVAGLALTAARVTAIASPDWILVFQNDQLLGHLNYDPESWARIAAGDLDDVEQVEIIDGQLTCVWPPPPYDPAFSRPYPTIARRTHQGA